MTGSPSANRLLVNVIAWNNIQKYPKVGIYRKLWMILKSWKAKMLSFPLCTPTTR
jgi:hypothetical protein